MTDPALPDLDVLRRAYAAFNARDLDATVATMATEVVWPKAFLGGVACGHQEVRDYWTEQWSQVDPHVEPINFARDESGGTLVHVHLVVRDLAGAVILDENVGHRFTMARGFIQSMEICSLPTR